MRKLSERHPVRWISERVKGAALFVILFVVWYFVARTGAVNKHILPAPSTVAHTFKHFVANGVIALDIKASLLLVAKGFGLGCTIGLLLGGAMGLSRLVEKLVGPTFHAVRQVPLLGWIPLIVMWFGVGNMSKVLFISIGAMYPIVLNTFEGIRSVPETYKELASVFEYGKLRTLWRVILPSALPSIITGIRIGVGTTWMLLVAAEILTVTSSGLGTLISESREQFRMDIALVGVVIIGVMGWIMNQSVGLFERRLLRWRKTG